jgi:hypothetical protein
LAGCSLIISLAMQPMPNGNLEQYKTADYRNCESTRRRTKKGMVWAILFLNSALTGGAKTLNCPLGLLNIFIQTKA